MPASYGANFIFGRAVKMRTVVNPTADQINSFFGVNGMESLFGGTRGRVTLVEGLLVDPSDISNPEETFVSYNDGVARVLVDTRGYTYENVKFGAFEPGDRIMLTSDGYYCRTYRASFNHLT